MQNGFVALAVFVRLLCLHVAVHASSRLCQTWFLASLCRCVRYFLSEQAEAFKEFGVGTWGGRKTWYVVLVEA